MSSNLTRGSQQVIDNTPIENGKIRFAVDSCRFFIDTATERLECTDFVKGLQYSEIIALQSPLPKVYLSSDTRQLMAYDYIEQEWVIYSGGDFDPSAIVSDVYYDATNGTTVKYLDGTTKILPHSSIEAEIEELRQRVSQLEQIVSEYVSVIEINTSATEE